MNELYWITRCDGILAAIVRLKKTANFCRFFVLSKYLLYLCITNLKQ